MYFLTKKCVLKLLEAADCDFIRPQKIMAMCI